MEYVSTEESVTQRIERLKLTDLNESRLKSLALAHAANVSDVVFSAIANAMRVARASSILLPAHRYEGLSRGKGWCRKGTHDAAVWAEREDGMYRVDAPGKWTIGGNDGFHRKGQTTWTVTHVAVGDAKWTLAS